MLPMLCFIFWRLVQRDGFFVFYCIKMTKTNKQSDGKKKRKKTIFYNMSKHVFSSFRMREGSKISVANRTAEWRTAKLLHCSPCEHSTRWIWKR